MSQGLQLNLVASINGAYTAGANPGGNAVADQVNLIKTLPFVTGAGANQADLYYPLAINIAASSSTTLDLSGAIVGALGETVVFVRVKAILLAADATNTNSIILGAAGSAPFLGPLGGTTPTITVPPGGIALLGRQDATGWTVTNSSNDQLKLANSSSGTAVTGTLHIIGSAE